MALRPVAVLCLEAEEVGAVAGLAAGRPGAGLHPPVVEAEEVIGGAAPTTAAAAAVVGAAGTAAAVAAPLGGRWVIRVSFVAGGCWSHMVPVVQSLPCDVGIQLESHNM